MPSAAGQVPSPLRQRRVQIALAGAVLSTLLAAFVVLDIPPSFPSEPHASIGKALARQAAALLGKGGKVIVVTRDTEAFPQPSLETLFNSFERGMRAAGNSIDTVQRLQTDPAKALEVPAGDFYELVRKAPPGSVVVSLMGPAVPGPEQFARLAPGLVKVVAFCPGNIALNTDLRRLFELSLLHAAVVDRVAARMGASGGTRDDFESLYAEVTSAGQLPRKEESP